MGSKKRCGGVGDILAGLVCFYRIKKKMDFLLILYSMWGANGANGLEDGEGILVGAALASYIVRSACNVTF